MAGGAPPRALHCFGTKFYPRLHGLPWVPPAQRLALSPRWAPSPGRSSSCTLHPATGQECVILGLIEVGLIEFTFPAEGKRCHMLTKPRSLLTGACNQGAAL